MKTFAFARQISFPPRAPAAARISREVPQIRNILLTPCLQAKLRISIAADSPMNGR